MELEKFCLFAGLRINTDKTSIIRTGEWPDMTQKLNAASRLRWTLDPIKILGIYIHPDKTILIERNYSILLQKVRDIILMWRYGTLTPYGKV